MGVNVSLRNDTDRVIKGYMEMLGGARVAGWKFKLQPLGEEGCTFQKKDGGLSIGLPYNCVLNVDLDGDGRPDKIRYRFKAEKQTKLVVSEMLKSVQVKLSGGDDSLIMKSTCSLRSGIFLSGGTLMIYPEYIAFVGNLSSKDVQIRFSDMVLVAKRHYLRLPNSIKFVVKAQKEGKEVTEDYFFTSFPLNRNKVFDCIAKIREGRFQKEFSEHSAVFQGLFKLDSSEIVQNRYNCSMKINDNPPAHGTLYISQNYVCFNSASLLDKISGKKIKKISAGSSGLLITLERSRRLYKFIRDEWVISATNQLRALKREWDDNAIDTDYIPDFADDKSFFIKSNFKDLVLELRPGEPVQLGRDLCIGDRLVLAERSDKPNQKFYISAKDGELRSVLQRDKKAQYWVEMKKGSYETVKDTKYETLSSFFDRVNFEVQPSTDKADVVYLMTKSKKVTHPGIARGLYKAVKGERMRRYLGIERKGHARTHHPDIQRSLIKSGAPMELGAAHNWLGRRCAQSQKRCVNLSKPGTVPGPMQEFKLLDEFDCFMEVMLWPLRNQIKTAVQCLEFGDNYRKLQASNSDGNVALRRARRHRCLWSAKAVTRDENPEGAVSFWRPKMRENEVFFGDICVPANGLKNLNGRDIGWIADSNPLLLPPLGFTLVCYKEPESLEIEDFVPEFLEGAAGKVADGFKNAVGGVKNLLSKKTKERKEGTPEATQKTILYIWRPRPPQKMAEKYHALGCVVTTTPEEPMEISQKLRCVPESLLLHFPQQTDLPGVLAWMAKARKKAKQSIMPTYAMYRNFGVNTFDCSIGILPESLNYRFGVGHAELESMITHLADDILNTIKTCTTALQNRVKQDAKTKAVTLDFNGYQTGHVVHTLDQFFRFVAPTPAQLEEEKAAAAEEAEQKAKMEADAKSPSGKPKFLMSGRQSRIFSNKSEVKEALEALADTSAGLVALISGEYKSRDRVAYSIDPDGYARECGKETDPFKIALLRPFGQVKPYTPPEPETKEDADDAKQPPGSPGLATIGEEEEEEEETGDADAGEAGAGEADTGDDAEQIESKMSAEDAENDEKKTTSPSKDSVTSVDQDEDDEAEDDEDVPTWNIRLVFLEPDMNDVFGYASEDGLSIRWDDGDEWTKTFGGGGHSNAYNIDDLLSAAGNISKLRNVLNSYAPEESIEAVHLCAKEYNKILGKLSQYFVKKFKDLVRKTAKAPLAPPNLKAAAFSLGPPIKLLTGAEKGKERKAPINVGWWKDKGNVEAVESQPIVVKDIELKSERFRYLEKDVGGIVVGIAVKTPISKTNFKEGKSYGYQGNKVWVNKGAHAIFSVAIMKPDKDAKASIMLVHKPGAVITTDIKTHCGGDNDYKPTRDFVFKLFFYDGDSTDKRKQFVSVSGFLMDGTCVEHAIGITTDGDKHDCYCVAPPEIHRGGVRASVSLERKTGLKKFVGGLQKFGAGVGKAFVGSRSNLAFVRTDVKRSVGWHEFKFIGSATKGVRYYVDKKCVYTSNTPRSIVEIESVRLWAGTLEDKGLVSDIRKLKFGGKKKPPAKAIFAGFTFLSTARKMEIPNSKAVIRPKIPPAFATLLDELVTNFRTLESLPPVTDEKTKTTRSMKEYIVDMIEPAVAERVKQSGDEDTQDLLDGTLKITVRRGENLEIAGVKGEMSVKISVPGSDRKALASSAQVHATQNPEWNWDRTFDLDAKKDRENVKILLVLSSKKAGDEVIGRIIMPMRKFIKTGRHDEKGKDYDLVGKVGGSLNIQIKHTSQGVLDLQGAWGDDFEIEDDGEEDEVIAEDDDKLSAEKAKALIKGLDSILDDQLYLNVIRNENTEEGIRIKSSFSAEMQAELMLRLALMYHDRVIKLIEDHTKQYKLETIRAVQLVSWLNSYRQRVEMLAVHFPNGSPDFDALKNKIFRDTGRMGALCMERYVTFRGKQQNSIVSRLISGEERFDVDEDTLAMWDRDGVNPSDVKTYTPQSLFTIVETSIDTIGSKYHISGKQLSREIHIQLSALEHFAQSLSILYDRVDFVPIYTKKNKRITSRDPDDIFGMSVADAKQIKTTDFLIEPGSAAGSSSRRAGDAKEVKKVRKSYYFLVASINNLELYKRYAEGVQKKLRERYVVDVDDLDDIKRGFDEILKELKGQAERCTGFLAQLIINNCDEIIAGLFTDEWTKPDCKFIDLVIERMQEGVDLFTNADIMESDEMADLVFQETILRFGLAYVYEANRKDVDKLRSDQLLEGVQRDYKVLCKIVLERLDEKAQEKIMPKLLPISLITGILLAPPMYKPLCQACVEFRKKLSFSSDDENNICRKILACRSDIARKDMVKITKGLKKGAFEGFTDVTLDDSKDALGGETKSDWVLDVTIEEGSDLMICDATTSDPFVIMTVIEDGHVVYRDKSPIRKKTLYPNWSYTVKKIPKKIMSEFDEIRFEVWDHDFWGSNDFMGCYDLQRSEILEGVQNAELQGEEIRPGAARFHLDLGPRFDEDGKKITSDGKIKGQIQVVVEHRDLLKKEQKQEEKETKGGPGKLKRQGSTFGKSLLESYRESDAKSQSPESQIPEVWKAGRLKKKQRSNGPFGIWQERAFEVHRDGHILWGKPTTTSKSWKMEEIGSFRCQPNEDFQFEVHFRRKKECLVLRALNRASFNRWMERIPVIIKLAEKERAEKEEEHQDINEFLDDEDNPHEADLDAFLS